MSGYASTQNFRATDHSQKQYIAKQSAEDASCSQLLFEKIENENESKSDWQMQAILLPYLASYFQRELSPSTLLTAEPLTLDPSSPIYLAVCNFRV